MKKYLLLLLVMVTGQSYAAGDCKAFNQDDEFFYKGECKDGYAHGVGLGKSFYEHNGSINVLERYKIYEGEWKNGMPNGKGKETFESFLYVYTGEVKDGRWDGYGVLKLLRANHPWLSDPDKNYRKYAKYEGGQALVVGVWKGRKFLRECQKIECDSNYDPYEDLDLKTKTDIVMNKITVAIKEGNYKDAVGYFPYLERVNNNLPESFYFYQMQSLSKSGRLDDAKEKAKDYLKKYGSKGKYYAEVIEIMGR